MRVTIEIEYSGDMKPKELEEYVRRKLIGVGKMDVKFQADGGKVKKKSGKKEEQSDSESPPESGGDG